MKTAEFVHLRVHTEYSLSDGLPGMKALARTAAQRGMPAVAVTDSCNFFGLVKFHKAALAAGLKPISGADLVVLEDDGQAFPLCLLVMDARGYRNLTQLISRAYREGRCHDGPRVRRDWLEGCSDGLIALSAGAAGSVGQALLNNRRELASERLRGWQALFPQRFYLELHRTGREYEEDYLHAAVDLAGECGCPVVATNDVRFLDADEFEAHEARVCIAESRVLNDRRRVRRYSPQQYLRTPAEMSLLFSDLPEALENSAAIARRCSFQLELGRVCLPEYPVPDDMTMESFFRRLSHDGLDERLAVILEGEVEPAARAAQTQRYRERLDFELDTILQMGFPGYFLIVMDFIRWAKEQGIPVGPGRGSGAGSLVAYSLSITDLDPLQYELLFERFLNPERVSMPDFDVDFCMERRDEVIEYVADRYGREAVSQIVTFGTLAAKAVVRDVARVQGKSYGLGDKLSKLIPFEVGMTLAKAHEQEAALREFLNDDQEAQEIWDMATQLEGVTRGVGKHAGGVVIAPSRLTDFSPLYCDEHGGGLVTQYDKNDVEDVGLVKFDFLGLRTLTIIDWAQKMINAVRAQQGDAPLDINRIPLDDVAAFELLKSAETTAVFQLESRGMRELIAQLRPDCFEDIIALVALYRPGPLQSGMVENFIDRKHGREALAFPDPDYQHESLRPILESTYGIILYQEQVMQIAQVLAGYSLGEADLLRRAMGKKKPEEMAKQRSVFARGAAGRGVDADLATKLFDLVEKFAGYGFNKSHSAAYALVSYQTAWLKAHYPAAFMAAVMSSELDNTDKIVVFIEECRRMGLTLRLPDINEGEYMFTVNADGAIVYGLGAIKGLGEGPLEQLLASRRAGGPFSDLFDFCARTDPRRLGRKAIDALVRSGAFDSLNVERWVLGAAIDDALRAAEQNAANRDAGMGDLFGDTVQASTDTADPYAAYRGTRAWTERERLQGERDTLGLYVTGHPIDECEAEVRRFAPIRLSEVRSDSRFNCRVAGLIVSLRIAKSSRGSMAILTLDDRTARLEVVVYSETYLQCRELLARDRIVVVEGRVRHDDRSAAPTIVASGVRSLADERARHASELCITVRAEQADERFRSFLRTTLAAAPGTCPVSLRYRQPGQSAALRLGDDWRVAPSEELLEELRRQLGRDSVSLDFSAPRGEGEHQ